MIYCPGMRFEIQFQVAKRVGWGLAWRFILVVVWGFRVKYWLRGLWLLSEKNSAVATVGFRMFSGRKSIEGMKELHLLSE